MRFDINDEIFKEILEKIRNKIAVNKILKASNITEIIEIINVVNPKDEEQTGILHKIKMGINQKVQKIGAINPKERKKSSYFLNKTQEIISNTQIDDKDKIKKIKDLNFNRKNFIYESQEDKIYDFINDLLNDTNNKQKIFTYKFKINEQEKKVEIARINDITSQAKKGGYVSNPISLLEVFKLFYNFLGNQEIDNSSITIYKLYFILNIYSYYNDDQTLILSLKKIIETGVYTDDIILMIEDIITKINAKTLELFLNYIKNFNSTDTIIKNYYRNYNQIVRYLFINFIYKFYKNLEANDINLKITINDVTLEINKTHLEILKEIDEMIATNNFIFMKEIIVNKKGDRYLTDAKNTEINQMIANNNFEFLRDIIQINLTEENLIEEVKFLLNFIYEFTSKPDDYQIVINNASELNAFIVMELLSSDTTIKININGNNYEIPNIKHKPYKFKFDNEKPLNISVNLNPNQFSLYDFILRSLNFEYLALVLKRDFYFIDFDITKEYNFKFYINSEIMHLLEPTINLKKTLINYNYYNYKQSGSEKINFLPILRLNDNKLISYINYAIYLISSLFSKISSYNFKSLIYLYSIIKGSSKEYLDLSTYKGRDLILLRYKEFINQIQLLRFIEEILLYMRAKIPISGNIENFTMVIINFKSNNPIFSQLKINLDKNLIEELFKNPYKDLNIKTENKIDIYDYIHKSLELLFDIYKTTNVTDSHKQLQDEIFIPLLKGLNKKGFNISDLEMKLLDFNTSLLKQKLMPIVGERTKGGDGTTNVNENDMTLIEKEKKDKEFIFQKLTKIYKFFEKFEKFKKDFVISAKTINNKPNDNTNDNTNGEKFTEGILKDYQEFITTNSTFENPYESGTQKSQNIDEITYPDPKKDINEFSQNLSKIKSKLNNQKRTVENVLLEFGINKDDSYTEPTSSIQIKLKELKNNLKEILEETLPLLEPYKDIDEILIRLNLANYFKLKDDDKTTILDDIAEYLKIYDKIIDAYIQKLKELYNKYKDQERNIQRLESTYDTVIRNPDYDRNYRNDNRNYPYGQYIGGFQKGGNFFNFAINDETIKNINNNLKRIDKVKSDYKKLKVATTSINSNTDNEEVLNNFYNKDGDNIFERILYQYDKDRKTSISEIAKGKLYDVVTDNNLDPEIELEVTFTDKIIFIILIVIIRTISLQITNYFIDKDGLTTVAKSLVYYMIGYVLIFLIIFMIINIDIFRLRLIFNYMNMHINSTSILIHIIMSIIIGYIVYLLIINISPENKPTRLSKNQKLKLKMRIEILTIAIITLLIIFILVV